MSSFQLANWNLDGYGRGASTRLHRQLEVLDALRADVLVLTEVRDTTRVPSMSLWWSDEGKEPYSPQDRAVGIASRWPGENLAVRDSRLSVCVMFDAPSMGPVIVYGTVIPYAQDGVRQKAAKTWERHRQAVSDLVWDVNALRSNPAHRDAYIVLAGDFNTNLDGTRWYGDPQSRATLVEGLTRAGLHCHTLENIRVTRQSDRAIVDHVWTSTNLYAPEPLKIWCDREEPGRLSDHNGVAIQLAKRNLKIE